MIYTTKSLDDEQKIPPRCAHSGHVSGALHARDMLYSIAYSYLHYAVFSPISESDFMLGARRKLRRNEHTVHEEGFRRCNNAGSYFLEYRTLLS